MIPEIELFEYTTVILPNGDSSIIYHLASLPVVEKPPSDPQSIEKLLEYLTDNSLKPLIEAIRTTVKSMGRGIDEYPTQGYIGYKHSSGRQFAYIRIFRKEFELGTHIIDVNKPLLNYDGVRIKMGDEDYSDILEKIKKSFVNLGGILHE